MKKILVLILVFSFITKLHSQALNPAVNTTVNVTPWGTFSSSVTNFSQSGAHTVTINGLSGATNAAQSDTASKLCGSLNLFMCVVAGLAAVQAVIAIADYFKSKDSRDKSACQGAFCNGDPTANNPNQPFNPNRPFDPYTYESPDPNDPMTPVLRQAQNTLRDLKTKGYEVKPDGSVKTPNGTMSGGQIAAAASNMSAEDQAKLAAIQAEAAAEGKKFADANFDGSPETGGGGGRKRGGGGDDGGSGFNMNAYLRSLNGGDAKRGVAGLSVRMGTDSVGVRESNIFDQVSAAYTRDTVVNKRDPVGP